MKKTILVMAVAISLFACSTPQATSTNDADAASLAAFKENSKVTISVFEAFAKKDLYSFLSLIV
jgi:ABC-type glycerol-3-phosphate transport system substrate-binding protein